MTRQTLALQAHPDNRSPAVHAIEVDCAITDEGALALEFRLQGDLDALCIPPAGVPGPGEGLWQQTCFEAFVTAPGESGYLEFNFSTSGQWATYVFSDVRQHTRTLSAETPIWMAFRPGEGEIALTLEVGAIALPKVPQIELGLAAIVDAEDGSRGYWALAHPPGEPDFHHRDSFSARLATGHASDAARG